MVYVFIGCFIRIWTVFAFPSQNAFQYVSLLQIRWRKSETHFSRFDAVRDSASPNPKMHQKRKTIEIETYCGSKYSKTAGIWSLTLVTLG